MTRTVLVCIALAAVAGCTMKSAAELRQMPPVAYMSKESVDSVTRCMIDAPTANMLETATYPQSHKAEFRIGGTAATYYLATAEPKNGHTYVEIRSQGKSLWALTESEFYAIVKRCAPPISE